MIENRLPSAGLLWRHPNHRTAAISAHRPRYEKRATNYLAMLHIGMILLWLKPYL